MSTETTEIIKQAFGYEMVMVEEKPAELERLKSLYKMQRDYEEYAEYIVGKELLVA